MKERGKKFQENISQWFWHYWQFGEKEKGLFFLRYFFLFLYTKKAFSRIAVQQSKLSVSLIKLSFKMCSWKIEFSAHINKLPNEIFFTRSFHLNCISVSKISVNAASVTIETRLCTSSFVQSSNHNITTDMYAAITLSNQQIWFYWLWCGFIMKWPQHVCMNALCSVLTIHVH